MDADGPQELLIWEMNQSQFPEAQGPFFLSELKLETYQIIGVLGEIDGFPW